MKIAIDCRSLRKKPAGVPNFLISVISTISVQCPKADIFLLTNEDFDPEVKIRLKELSGIVIKITPLPIFPKVAILWYLLKLPGIVRELKADIFYTPIPNLPLFISPKTKTMITIHDMVYKNFPETMSRGNWWINFLLHNYSIRTADYIWAISRYTRHEIENYYQTRKSKLIFVGSSIDKSIFYKMEISKEQKAQFSNDFELGEKFILFVGTLEPRKNISFLISLVPELTKHGFDLLIVGAKGWGKNEMNQLDSLTEDQKRKVKFSGFISTQQLVLSYHMASAYVSTSLNEGFGLPQLEAMNCGCPVVSPHNSAMIEIVEGAGETVIGWDLKDWISAILKVVENRNQYLAKGFERAAEYEWNDIIEKLASFTRENSINEPTKS